MKRADHAKVPTAQKQRAQRMRSNQTPHERRLWRALRQRLPLESTHFRRQVSIGPYVVDFCCLKHQLVIEVDGNQHGTDAAQAIDAKRTALIEAQGFRVMRFSNFEIHSSLDSVLDTVFAALETTPTPNPSPQGGGEEIGRHV